MLTRLGVGFTCRLTIFAILPLSLNRYFDAAIARGTLHGMAMRGSWITVGTPDAIPLAEAAVEKALAVGAV